MAHIIDFNPSRTLMEFRLLPRLTTNATKSENISLQTPLVYSPQQNKKYYLNIPIVSAAMQSVSGEKMGIELAKLGGTSFIYCSQSIESQTEMIAKVKSHKAGFVVPRTVLAEILIKELHALKLETGYNIFPVVDHDNRFLGLITRNDYDVSLHGHLMVRDRMIGKDQLVVGTNINSLKTANNILMESHQSLLPILNDTFNLLYLVFRKDINDHLDNPYQAVDEKKRLLSVASINTHDFRERVPVLINAGADALAVDSSDGFTIFQKETLQWITENFPGVPVIGGNVVTAKGFRSLVESGASAVKVGMGSGSICITQEQKGTGRGLATAIIKTVEERNKYYGETGKYIPVVADGGIVNSKDIVIALALGADYVMMGRYFARMEESPTDKITINNRIMKPYWGEGSNRARDWKQQRYHQAKFIEGVEGFVEYAGKLKDNMEVTISKIKSTLSTCGVSNIKELHENSELELVSSLSIREGKVHDIFIPENSDYLNDTNY
jgi:IMP dehydrogenase